MIQNIRPGHFSLGPLAKLGPQPGSTNHNIYIIHEINIIRNQSNQYIKNKYLRSLKKADCCRNYSQI